MAVWHVWEERWIAYTACLTVGLIAIGWGVKYIIKSVLATVKMMHSNCALPSCSEPAGSSDGGWGGAPLAAALQCWWGAGTWGCGEAGLALMALPKPGSTSWTPSSLWHESSALPTSALSLRWGLQQPEGSRAHPGLSWSLLHDDCCSLLEAVLIYLFSAPSLF